MSTKLNLKEHTFKSTKLKSVVDEAVTFFLTTPVHPLPPEDKFDGGGVYALYYFGDFDLYSEISVKNQKEIEHPIYIGKAVPSGWRTGRTNIAVSSVLYNRLREHSRSVKQVSNLSLDDFKCRFMILDDVEADLVVPVEAEMIRIYKPLWNQVIDGFGNHDPGKGRYEQAPSEWDALHPGRDWVSRLKGEPPEIDNVKDEVEKYSRDL